MDHSAFWSADQAHLAGNLPALDGAVYMVQKSEVPKNGENYQTTALQ